MSRPRHVLVLFTHPALQSSRVNRTMLEALSEPPAVALTSKHYNSAEPASIEIHDLYETYPDFFLDVRAEQERLSRADLLVFQFPLFWYSMPALLKQWQDEVLELGWAYGDGGTRLAGKDFLLALSTGGSAESFHNDGPNRFSITELLRPFEAMAWLCGMLWHPPFIYHGTYRAADTDIAAHALRYRALLMAYVERGTEAFDVEPHALASSREHRAQELE